MSAERFDNCPRCEGPVFIRDDGYLTCPPCKVVWLVQGSEPDEAGRNVVMLRPVARGERRNRPTKSRPGRQRARGWKSRSKYTPGVPDTTRTE